MVDIERTRQLMADAYIAEEAFILNAVTKRLARFGIGGSDRKVREDLALEVMQDAFATLFQEDKLAGYDPAVKPVTWILSFCVNKAKSLSARRRTERLRRVDHLRGDFANAEPNEALDHLISPREAPVSSAASDLVADLLTQVSPAEREWLRLVYLEGIPQVELAASLGLSVGTLNSRLSRVRSKLRAR